MKALVLEAGRVRLAERPMPRPAAGEALVRVRHAGICATDLAVVRGYAGHRGTLGHEMVGVVEACEDRDWVGRRVAVEINVSCGTCAHCLRGLRTHCERREVMGIRDRDGCFAEYVAMPVANLHRVPDAVPDEQAVFTEPLAAAFRIREQVALDGADRVAILGDGRLGLLVAMALRASGLMPLVVGRHERKLAIAAALGLPTVKAGEEPDDFDLVVEATGSPAGFERALQIVRPCGTVVLKSSFAERPAVDAERVVVNEIRVVGSRCGPFDVALAALAAGRVDPTPLIDARYPLSDAVLALEHASRRGTLKVLLTP